MIGSSLAVWRQPLVGVATIVVVFLVATFALACDDADESVPNVPSLTIPPQTHTRIPAELSPTSSAPAVGIVEGSITYPGSAIPKELIVCATNLDSPEDTCTANRISDPRFTIALGYRLALPPGTYEVYAALPGRSDLRGYYTEYVRCGGRPPCEDHTRIQISLSGGQTITGVDPTDWSVEAMQE